MAFVRYDTQGQAGFGDVTFMVLLPDNRGFVLDGVTLRRGVDFESSTNAEGIGTAELLRFCHAQQINVTEIIHDDNGSVSSAVAAFNAKYGYEIKDSKDHYHHIKARIKETADRLNESHKKPRYVRLQELSARGLAKLFNAVSFARTSKACPCTHCLGTISVGAPGSRKTIETYLDRAMKSVTSYRAEAKLKVSDTNTKVYKKLQAGK